MEDEEQQHMETFKLLTIHFFILSLSNDLERPVKYYIKVEVIASSTFQKQKERQRMKTKVRITPTSTRAGVADVNAVHLHVDFVLHVPPLLVNVEDQTSIWPEVKPVPLPAPQDGAW